MGNAANQTEVFLDGILEDDDITLLHLGGHVDDAHEVTYERNHLTGGERGL